MTENSGASGVARIPAVTNFTETFSSCFDEFSYTVQRFEGVLLTSSLSMVSTVVVVLSGILYLDEVALTTGECTAHLERLRDRHSVFETSASHHISSRSLTSGTEDL